MEQFTAIIFSFPTAVFTTPLIILGILWIFTLLGALDFDFFHIDTPDLHVDAHVDMHVDTHVDHHADFDTSDIGWFAGILCSWGLTGVPVNITFTILFFIGWLISYFATLLLTPLLLDGVFIMVAGIAIMLVAFSISVVMTA